jgi:hypothetical protein
MLKVSEGDMTPASVIFAICSIGSRELEVKVAKGGVGFGDDQ